MLDRCQNITWLVSHMGGPIHTLLARIDRSRHQSAAKNRPLNISNHSTMTLQAPRIRVR
jgi:hypothetical protein